MNQLMLEHHGKPGCTGWPFRPSMGLLGKAHQKFFKLYHIVLKIINKYILISVLIQ